MDPHHTRLHRSEHGFSLVELVVVVAIMGTLIAIAMPVFAGSGARAGDRAAELLVRTGFETAKSVDRDGYSSVTLADVTSAEPSVHFVDGATVASSDKHQISVVFGATGSGEDYVLLASRSRSGTCFAIVDHEHGAPAYQRTGPGPCRASAFDPGTGWSDAWA